MEISIENIWVAINEIRDRLSKLERVKEVEEGLKEPEFQNMSKKNIKTDIYGNPI